MNRYGEGTESQSQRRPGKKKEMKVRATSQRVKLAAAER